MSWGKEGEGVGCEGLSTDQRLHCGAAGPLQVRRIGTTGFDLAVEGTCEAKLGNDSLPAGPVYRSIIGHPSFDIAAREIKQANTVSKSSPQGRHSDRL